MFFSLPNEYTPAGLFSGWHFLMLFVTGCFIALGLYCSRHMDKAAVRRTVRVVTVLLWVLETAKILFVLLVVKSRNPNDFVPLYYCSLILYAGLLSSCREGLLRRCGDCFIATAGLVGGIVFLVMPTTSLPRYPTFHFISLHSFLLHGLMVYLALLLMLRNVYRPRRLRDIRYPAVLIGVTCLLALAFNVLYDTLSGQRVANLMFISKNFPGTPIAIIYRITGPLFTPFMCLVQAFGPYLLVYWSYLLVNRLLKSYKDRTRKALCEESEKL